MKNKDKKKNLVLINATHEQTFDELVEDGVTLGEFVKRYLEANHLEGVKCDAHVAVDDGPKLQDPNTVLENGSVVSIHTTKIDLRKTDEVFKQNLKAYMDGTLDPATDGGFSERMDKLMDVLPEILDKHIEEAPQKKSRPSGSRRSRHTR